MGMQCPLKAAISYERLCFTGHLESVLHTLQAMFLS